MEMKNKMEEINNAINKDVILEETTLDYDLILESFYIHY